MNEVLSPQRPSAVEDAAQFFADDTSNPPADDSLAVPTPGGTGRYRHARGESTVHVPQDVPNLADANFVLRLR
jgi:hypothetical protein